MNAKVESIELTALQHQIDDLVAALTFISNEADTVIQAHSGWIHIDYVNRGTEKIALSISNQYSIKTQIQYLAETLVRLKKIKNYMLECAA